MKVKEIVNTSKDPIIVRMEDGGSVMLPPTGNMQNVNITNLDELRPKVHAIEGIVEVMPEGKTSGNVDGKRQYLKG